jgi:hypothetical protein
LVSAHQVVKNVGTVKTASYVCQGIVLIQILSVLDAPLFARHAQSTTFRLA